VTSAVAGAADHPAIQAWKAGMASAHLKRSVGATRTVTVTARRRPIAKTT